MCLKYCSFADFVKCDWANYKVVFLGLGRVCENERSLCFSLLPAHCSLCFLIPPTLAEESWPATSCVGPWLDSSLSPVSAWLAVFFFGTVLKCHSCKVWHLCSTQSNSRHMCTAQTMRFIYFPMEFVNSWVLVFVFCSCLPVFRSGHLSLMWGLDIAVLWLEMYLALVDEMFVTKDNLQEGFIPKLVYLTYASVIFWLKDYKY